MPSLLIFEGPYYSQLDEAAFFTWLEAIAGVKRVVGTPDGLVVTLRSSKLSEAALRDMLALHWRYRLPMKDLAKFHNAGNDRWFRNPGSYWHEAVFGARAVSADLAARIQELHSAGKSATATTNAICREYQLHKSEARRRILVSSLWRGKAVNSPDQLAKSAA